MTRIFNRASQKVKRQWLRDQMPPAERILWSKLKERQMLGCKFRRQYGVGAFAVDFYAPSIRLAIELDGDTHFGNDAQENDAKRQEFIEGFGIFFLRFT